MTMRYLLRRTMLGYLTHPEANTERQYTIASVDGMCLMGTVERPYPSEEIPENRWEARCYMFDDGYRSFIGFFTDLSQAAAAVADIYGRTRDASKNVNPPASSLEETS